MKKLKNNLCILSILFLLEIFCISYAPAHATNTEDTEGSIQQSPHSGGGHVEVQDSPRKPQQGGTATETWVGSNNAPIEISPEECALKTRPRGRAPVVNIGRITITPTRVLRYQIRIPANSGIKITLAVVILNGGGNPLKDRLVHAKSHPSALPASDQRISITATARMFSGRAQGPCSAQKHSLIDLLR